jgi:hypothetical protein
MKAFLIPYTKSLSRIFNHPRFLTYSIRMATVVSDILDATIGIDLSQETAIDGLTKVLVPKSCRHVILG